MDFQFKAGTLPFLVSMPHVGTDIPDDIAARLSPVRAGAARHRLAPGASCTTSSSEMGASTISARWSRYVIDLNRPPENTNLYPGMDTTGLCPVDTFGSAPLYLPGQQPDEDEVRAPAGALLAALPRASCAPNLTACWRIHGKVVLWDAHSIASVVPRFFEGRLPDLNFGTACGASCDAGAGAGRGRRGARRRTASRVAVNGRFKGGYITRHYGQPANERPCDPARDVPVPVHGRNARRSPTGPDRAREVQAAAAADDGSRGRLGARMNALFARHALLPEGWRRDVLHRMGRARRPARGDAGRARSRAACRRPDWSCPAWSTCIRTPSSARWAA